MVRAAPAHTHQVDHHPAQAATATLAAAGAYALDHARPAQCETALLKKKKALPEYTTEEVAKHTTRETRVWVTYKVSRALLHVVHMVAPPHAPCT